MRLRREKIVQPIISVVLLLALAACTSVTINFGGGPSGASSAPPTTAQTQQLAAYVLDLINQDRKAQGLPPYVQNDALAKGAHEHNLKMAAVNTLEHQTPGEPELGDRITNDGLHWNAVGENVGVASYPDLKQGVLAMHQGMMAEKPPEDGHRQNILSKTFHLVGIDVYIDGKNQIWLTEDFARLG